MAPFWLSGDGTSPAENQKGVTLTKKIVWFLWKNHTAIQQEIPQTVPQTVPQEILIILLRFSCPLPQEYYRTKPQQLMYHRKYHRIFLCFFAHLPQEYHSINVP